MKIEMLIINRNLVKGKKNQGGKEEKSFIVPVSP